MIKSFWHTGIVVQSMERALTFYRDTLGLEVEREGMLSGDKIDRILGNSNIEAKNAMIGQGATHIIELVEYVKPVGGDAYHPINARGNVWLGFYVNDLEALHRELSAKGVKFVNPPTVLRPDPPPGRVKAVAYAQDPDGNWLEFAELQE